MKEELITFETAKLAKEKGFTDFHAPLPSLIFDKKYMPTQSLLQKWLREVHNIHVYPLMQREWLHSESRLEFQEYICMVFSLKDTPDMTILPHIESLDFDFTIHESTYEEALEKGLQEALKLIKNE